MSSPNLDGRDEDRRMMFPRLTTAQIDRLRPLGRERRVAAGEVLFEHGARDLPFLVILEGEVAILLPTVLGEHVVARQGAGEFVGDYDMLAGRPAVVRARADTDGRVVEIERQRVHHVVQHDPEIADLLLRAFLMRRMALLQKGQGDLAVVGSRDSAHTLHILEFLTRNGRPHTFVDVDREPAARKLLEDFHIEPRDVPVVLCGRAEVLKRPSIETLAEKLGLTHIENGAVRDLIIVGGGPAGLAAAVYAASEGLDVLVLEAVAPGGQAGTSSKIENYLGFPTGVSGLELTGRAMVQAERFGASFNIARVDTCLADAQRAYRVKFSGGGDVEARAVIIASGARYRKPQIENLERFEGAGVYYAATKLEADMCQREEAAVVGGGNSAGQAAVFLSRQVDRVHMLVRGDGLAESMSKYLIDRIHEIPNISLRTRTRIEALEGERRLERIRIVDGQERRDTLPVRHVFIMTGADPHTGWLGGCVKLDPKGFVETGLDLNTEELRDARWPLERQPYVYETSLPRVFAVGDVRAGSIKRVAAAVGEGSACVSLVHRVLAE